MSLAYEVFVIKKGALGVTPAVSHDSFANLADARRFAKASPFKGFGVKLYETRRDKRGKLIAHKLLLRR